MFYSDPFDITNRLEISNTGLLPVIEQEDPYQYPRQVDADTASICSSEFFDALSGGEPAALDGRVSPVSDDSGIVEDFVVVDSDDVEFFELETSEVDDFFDNLEEIHANPYAYNASKSGAINDATILQRLVGLVKKVVHKIFGFDQFAKITNAFLERYKDNSLLDAAFKASHLAHEYEFLAAISGTSGKMGELAQNVMMAALPSVEDIKEFEASMPSLETAKAIQQQKEDTYNRLKSLRNLEGRAARIAAAEEELLAAAQEVVNLERDWQEKKEFFVNIVDSPNPEHPALTKRYYEDRKLRDTGVFVVNDDDNDLPALMRFVNEELGNDEKWHKTLELLLTQEAYMGFSHLSMIAYKQDNHLEIVKKCTVKMEKIEGEGVKVEIEFPMILKKAQCLPSSLELTAKKEYLFRKEGDQVQLVDCQERLSS